MTFNTFILHLCSVSRPEVLTHNVTKSLSIAAAAAANADDLRSSSSSSSSNKNNKNPGSGQSWSNVVHVYEVDNKGPSTIDKAFVYIYWPSFNVNGQPLLELTREPIIKGNGVCYNIRTPQQV